jgi:hypothetical protein
VGVGQPPFWLSIGTLGLVQAALVAAPRPRPLPEALSRLGGRWWAIAPALSIVLVVAAIELSSDAATWLTYLALVAVPPLAALALALLVRGARAAWAWGAVPLCVLAWTAVGSLAGEAAATALTGLACIALGWLLVAAVPGRWVRLGVYAMAVVDTIYVGADILQGPNAVLNAAAPGAGLPALQAVHFGSAAMGFGDLFIAAVVGCLLAADGPECQRTLDVSARRQRGAAALVVLLALAFDLLFFAVDELPATVPVAVALAVVTRRGGAGQL